MQFTTPDEYVEIFVLGISAGSSHGSTGGGTNYLCLPNVPQWKNERVNVGKPPLSTIYGAEYRLEPDTSPFSTVNNGGRSLLNHDAPCVVCHVPERKELLMIPARNNCTDNRTYIIYTLKKMVLAW